MSGVSAVSGVSHYTTGRLGAPTEYAAQWPYAHLGCGT
jgi:hypothetical protein